MSYLLLITVLAAFTDSTIEAAPITKDDDGLKQNAHEYKDMADYMDHFVKYIESDEEYTRSFSVSTETIKQLKDAYADVSKLGDTKKTLTDEDLKKVEEKCNDMLFLIDNGEYLMHKVEQIIEPIMRKVRTSVYDHPLASNPDCEKVFVENLASALQTQQISRAIDLKAFYITLQTYFSDIKEAITNDNKDIKTLEGYKKMIANVNAGIKQDPDVKDAQYVLFGLKETSDTLFKFANLMKQLC